MHICLFDIDGTLIKSGGAGKAALEMALAEVFALAPDLRNIELSGRTDRAILRDLLREHALAETPANVQRLFAAYLLHLPSCMHTHAGLVLPGIAALLGQLGQRSDVAIGLLTGNIRRGAHLKLGHFGLWDHFAFGGFGDLHLDRNDVAWEALGEAQRRFGQAIAPERIWVIGDTPLDVRCARAIGARAVAVATGWHTPTQLEEHGPDLLISGPLTIDSFPFLR
jgi:phosphoglycolate phosphatase-like HAD superfamily hydrolase